ncbi:2-hydroxyacid dehydrogenase [Georgenia sp. Z1491]|uniref:2-hydroxyacid dehydrogenase n=1 Tax=Georgenia sp. Z1491 TaxID=3416707 RepID=UPI003CF1D0E8
MQGQHRTRRHDEHVSRPAVAPAVAVTSAMDSGELSAITAALDGIADVAPLAEVGEQERAGAFERASALISWHPDREVTEEDWHSAVHVRLLQTVSAGLDHVSARRIPPGVTVATNAGAYAEPMAEHAIAMILALAKRLLGAHSELATGVFDQTTTGRSLVGQTAVILGYGGIGRAVAKLLRPFGVRVIGISRSGTNDGTADDVVDVHELARTLPHADILVLTLPLTRRTAGLIDAEALASMRDDAIRVNVARGEIVDQQALYARLVAEPRFLAGIDAWWVEPFRHGRFELDHPFFELPNVLGSPHNSASVTGARRAGAQRAATNVARYLRGEQPQGVATADDWFSDH